jgi:hypothetical protein
MRVSAISLAAYLIKVKDVSEHRFKVLSDVDGKDLFEFFFDELDSLKATANNNKLAQELLRVNDLRKKKRQLTGIIETGQYGRETILFDVNKKSVAHRRAISEAEMLPFYFLLEIPEGTDEGFLILQRTGAFGIRSTLSAALGDRFTKAHSDHRLRFYPAVSSEAIDKAFESRIENIRLLRFSISSDIAESVGLGHKELEGSMEIVIKARRGKSFPMPSKFRRVMTGNKDVRELVMLDDFQPDNVKVGVRVGRQIRTLNLGDVSKFRSYYDVSDKVKMLDSGFPSFESINAAAQTVVEEMKERIYGRAAAR